ncbi:hypothetical protein SASPL_151689 [Salvia splendens]|uniref:Shikimate O-hydroxycinnamoyltransferase n=1 Tax=Salvia splendens TaxID=180675 RepID=A0A8X8Z2W8_SALSN|nr:hypothetical protein SASPL_151689 [Salvia splendens]
MDVAELTAEEGFSRFKELLPYNGVLNLEGLQRPLLAITKLKDGLAMGLAFNHAIIDGTSTCHFMSSWAAICNRASSVSAPPFLERTKARNTRVKLDLSQPSDAPEHANSASNGLALRGKVFKFSASAIERIKTKANANANATAGPFSTFQSLSARVAGCDPRARARTHRLHGVFGLPEAGRPAHAGELLREPDPGNLHGERGGSDPVEPNRVRGGADPGGDPVAQRRGDRKEERGVGEQAGDIRVQGRWGELRGGGELAAISGVWGGFRVGQPGECSERVEQPL